MVKNNSLKTALSPTNVLTKAQMMAIKGGIDTSVVIATAPVFVSVTVGPISATDDDKRRDRPGGGISTH